MKDFDLGKIDNLLKFKESLSDVIDKKINSIRLNESVSSIDKMPFLAVTNIFEEVSDKLYETKKGKTLIKNFVKTIKENKDLKNVYKLYSTLKRSTGLENPSLFLQESISLSKPNDTVKYEESLEKLRGIVKECVTEANVTSDVVNGLINGYKGSLNESIDYIMNNDKSFKNLNEYVGAMGNIIGHLSTEKCERKTIDESKTVNDLVNELDHIIGEGMEPWESRVVKDIAMLQITGKDKKELFEEYKEKCISTIDEGIENLDTEKASRLNEMKTRLNAKEYNEETVNEDLLKLSELCETLS